MCADCWTKGAACGLCRSIYAEMICCSVGNAIHQMLLAIWQQLAHIQLGTYRSPELVRCWT